MKREPLRARPDRGRKLSAVEVVRLCYERYPKTMEMLRQSELAEGVRE